MATFAYAAGGNETNVYLPDSNPANHPTFTYLYDAADNRTQTIDPLGNTTTTVYDALYRPTITIDPLGHAVTMVYDGNGNMIAQKDAVRGTTSFSYDAANRGHERPSYVALGPVKRPAPWLPWVNQSLSVQEREALRRSVERGTPYGGSTWVAKTAQRLGLQSTLRPRGRPRKEQEAHDSA